MALKGRNVFLAREAQYIKDLLVKIRNSPKDLQKDYRDTLRNKHHFFISDFTNSKKGFTANDFDGLVKTGKIAVNKDVLRVS